MKCENDAASLINPLYPGLATLSQINSINLSGMPLAKLNLNKGPNVVDMSAKCETQHKTKKSFKIG